MAADGPVPEIDGDLGLMPGLCEAPGDGLGRIFRLGAALKQAGVMMTALHHPAVNDGRLDRNIVHEFPPVTFTGVTDSRSGSDRTDIYK